MLLTKKPWNKQKKESAKKVKKDQKLVSIDDEITQLNLKKWSLEEAIKEYQLEVDSYVFEVEKKENLRVIKIIKWFKESCWEEADWIGRYFEETKMPRKENEASDRCFFSFAIFLYLNFSYSFCRERKLWHRVIYIHMSFDHRDYNIVYIFGLYLFDFCLFVSFLGASESWI